MVALAALRAPHPHAAVPHATRCHKHLAIACETTCGTPRLSLECNAQECTSERMLCCCKRWASWRHILHGTLAHTAGNSNNQQLFQYRQARQLLWTVDYSELVVVDGATPAITAPACPVNTCMHSADVQLNIHDVMSWPPTAKMVPLGCQSNHSIASVGPSRAALSSPDAMDHNRVTPSMPPVAATSPLGSIATQATVSVWPANCTASDSARNGALSCKIACECSPQCSDDTVHRPVATYTARTAMSHEAE